MGSPVGNIVARKRGVVSPFEVWYPRSRCGILCSVWHVVLPMGFGVAHLRGVVSPFEVWYPRIWFGNYCRQGTVAMTYLGVVRLVVPVSLSTYLWLWGVVSPFEVWFPRICFW